MPDFSSSDKNQIIKTGNTKAVPCVWKEGGASDRYLGEKLSLCHADEWGFWLN